MSLLDRHISFVWIGRFSSKTGYGKATREIFEALRGRGLRLTGIDITSQSVVANHDDSARVSVNGERIKIEPTVSNQALVAVIHDVPTNWGRVEANGDTFNLGYTVFETEDLPVGWDRYLHAMPRVLTASDFNVDMLRRNGMHSRRLRKLYHVVEERNPEPFEDHLNLRRYCNDFVFLSVVSNLNRKDVGALVRGFTRAFYGRTDVSLVIKCPGNIKDPELRDRIVNAGFPEVDFNDPATPHVLMFAEHLSDEEMASLYRISDAVVSTERAKGFDLNCAEAMLHGKPTIAVGWSANLEFMTGQNSLLLESAPSLVPTDPNLYTNAQLYAGKGWATFSTNQLAETMRRCVDEPESVAELGRSGRETIQNMLNSEAIVDQFLGAIADLQPHDAADWRETKLLFHKTNRDVVGPSTSRRATKFGDLSADETALFKRDDGENHEDYIQKRRPLWGKYGAVLPDEEQRERMAAIKDRFLGQSIFIIGNGPSLKYVNMDLLSDHYTFAVNRIYLLFDKFDWRPSFYTCLDWRVIPDNADEINELSHSTFFFPWRFYGLLREGTDVFWYESCPAGRSVLDSFEVDATNAIRGGGTVATASMQLAWHMGFRHFYLLGCDASYQVKSTVQQSGGERFNTGHQIHLQSTADDDDNHFDPRYFGTGKKWHDPNVDEMRRGFLKAMYFIEAHGGSIVDCTEGGKLDFIPKANLSDVLKDLNSGQ